MSDLHFPPETAWRPLLALALAEDIGPGDVTSRVSIPREARGAARIEARERLVVCGLPLVVEVFRAIDPALVVVAQTEDGKTVEPGTALVRISGSVHSILAGERLALNFLGRMSGVATTTRRYVDAVGDGTSQIVDTRKTLPGWRMLDKYAVLAGGGTNHRIGLFDGILLKDNHIAAAGNVAAAVSRARANAPANLRVQCEVESLEQAREAWQAGADMLLLDNRTPDEIREIVAASPEGLVLEASGGITLDNVRDYAQTGVHRISIGALTHSALNVDVALEMESDAGAGEAPTVAHEGPARVLEILDRSTQAVSGEALSSELGVSRAQIWKHVERLRGRGYTIEGERGGGYQLTGRPDRLYPEEIQSGLATKWLGRKIHYEDTTDSTNRVAFDLARKGAVHGTAVIAEGQTAGRGRLGRSFFSPPYLNLYNSIVLRPRIDTVEAPTLIPAAGVAVAEAIAEQIGDASAVAIKWPNDVQLGGLKTSGILMEMSAEATRVDFAILGIGVNLNVDRETFPEEFRAQATSLRSHLGSEVPRAAFVRRLYTRLEEVLDLHASQGFAALRPRYEARFAMRGQPIRVAEMDGRERRGIAHGIADDGALELESEEGRIERIIAGDVTLVRPQDI